MALEYISLLCMYGKGIWRMTEKFCFQLSCGFFFLSSKNSCAADIPNKKGIHIGVFFWKKFLSMTSAL
jgi:hypothetical protein